MFEFTPFLDGKRLTYTEYFCMYGFMGFFAVGTACCLISGLLLIILRYCVKFNPPKVLLYSGQSSVDDPNVYNTLLQQPPENIEVLERQYMKTHWLKDFAIYLWNIGWFCYSLLPVVLSSFNIVIPTWGAIAMMFLILRYCTKNLQAEEIREARAEPFKTLNEINDSIDKINQKYKRHTKRIICLSLAWPLFFAGLCLSIYDSRVGIHISSLSISTRFIRLFEVPEACPPGPPCHIYATLPEDGATGVFINVQTSKEHHDIELRYDTQEYFNQTGKLRYSPADQYAFTTEGMEDRGKRRVHNALLNNLESDTMYVIQIEYDGKLQATELYRSLPDSDSTRDILIATGGDMGININSLDVTLQAMHYNPDVIVIGGDMAYDDGMCECFFTWDFWLSQFDLFSQKVGRLVPILLSVGNHDVGLNALPERNVTISKEGPPVFTYFPQHTVFKNGQQVIPEIHERRSYHSHIFGKILHLNLDSGYFTDYNGTQLDFIIEMAQKYPDYVKFASYHNPTFYTCANYANADAVVAGLTYWNPVFDRFKFIAIFENHEHTFKRSFKILGNRVNQNGTYYLGNGNWGAHVADGCPLNNKTGLLEEVKWQYHFWLVTISQLKGIVEYSAFNNFGVSITENFEQTIANYILQ